jgi:predicted phosphodiesterase
MRIAVLSDMHGNLAAFETALADLAAQGGADRLWFLGDYAAFGPRPAECVALVRNYHAEAEADEGRKGTVRAIRGNTDRYLVTGQRMSAQPVGDADALVQMAASLRTLHMGLLWGLDRLTFPDYEFLAGLPGEIAFRPPGFGPVIAYHGTPGDDEGMLVPEMDDSTAADALLDREGVLGIGGHIHRQFDRALAGTGWRIVNVGSVGMSFDRPGYAQYGLLTVADGALSVELRAVPYDVDAVLADAAAVGHPALDWYADRLREGR